MVFVAVGADTQHRVTVGEGTPQRAALTGGPPAGLIHVQRLGDTNAIKQISVGILKRV
jgi:hypothetical protein